LTGFSDIVYIYIYIYINQNLWVGLRGRYRMVGYVDVDLHLPVQSVPITTKVVRCT